MARKLGELLIDIGANVARFQSDMDKVKSATKKGMDFVSKSTSMAKKAIAGIVTVAALKSIADMGAAAIQAGEKFDKMSKRIGISVNQLTKLSHAANLSGTNIDQVEMALKGLAKKFVEAESATSQAAKAFAELNIQTKDPKGNFRDLMDVFFDIADGMNGMEDAAKKAALSQMLFEESGTRLVPLLSAGSKGIKAMMGEVRGFSKEFAKASADYNDNMERLRKISKQADIFIMNELLPHINQLSSMFVRSAKHAGLLGGAILTLHDIFQVGIGAKDWDKEQENLTEQYVRLHQRVGYIRTTITGLQKELEFARSRGAAMKIQDLENRIADKQFELEQSVKNIALLNVQIKDQQRAEFEARKAKEQARIALEQAKKRTEEMEAALQSKREEPKKGKRGEDDESPAEMLRRQLEEKANVEAEWQAAQDKIKAERREQLLASMWADHATDMEILQQQYKDRRDLLAGNVRDKLELDKWYSKAKKKITDREGKDEARAKRSAYDNIYNALEGFLGRQHKIVKAAASAKALMRAHEAYNEALAAYPPPMGKFMAISALIAGLAQVKAINSVSMGSSGASGATGGASTTESPTASQQQQQPVTNNNVDNRSLAVQFAGPAPGNMQEWVREYLAPMMTEAFGDDVDFGGLRIKT